MKLPTVLLLLCLALTSLVRAEEVMPVKTDVFAVKRELVWPEIKDPQALIDFAKAEIAKKGSSVFQNYDLMKNETVAYLHPRQIWAQPDFLLIDLDTHPLTGQALLILSDTNKPDAVHKELWARVEDTSSPHIKRVLQRFPTANSGTGLDTYLNESGFRANASVRWGVVRHLDENRNSCPRAIKLIYPYFPWDLLRQGIGGEAKLEFTITEQGLVSELRISATHKEFEGQVREAAQLWRFEPGVDLGTRMPVSSRMALTIKFVADDN